MLSLIPFPCGAGARVTGCSKGAEALQKWVLAEKLCKLGLPAKWSNFPDELPQGDALHMVSYYCRELQNQVRLAMAESNIPVALGGDHSMAIGGWSGIIEQCDAGQRFGLIWVDAHMDAHTTESSPSGALHGMPLSYLLGYGNDSLSALLGNKPAIAPEHLCLIGIRSYEEGEHDLLQKLGVRIFYMDEVSERGFKDVMQEAIAIATNKTKGFGLTVDLDGLDPEDAPGVGCPEAGGIKKSTAMVALKGIGKNPLFRGLEIAEYNPERDTNYKTAELVMDIIVSVFDR